MKVCRKMKKGCGGAVIVASLLPMAHERWATVAVKEKSPEIEKMAQEMESEFRDELGRHISLFIKVPFKNRLKNLLLNI